jgi:hypothetical protein
MFYFNVADLLIQLNMCAVVHPLISMFSALDALESL